MGAETLVVALGGVLRPWSDTSTECDHKGLRPRLHPSHPYDDI